MTYYEEVIRADVFDQLKEHYSFDIIEAKKFWAERGEKILSNIYDCISNEVLAEVATYTKEDENGSAEHKRI